MTAAETVRKDLLAYVEENFLYLKPDVEVGPNDDLLALGVIDSLGFIELVEEVQARYEVDVADVEVTEQNFGSIDAIAGFVERKQAAGA
jgi:acyl carrier protein